jgi:hypothetical protein
MFNPQGSCSRETAGWRLLGHQSCFALIMILGYALLGGSAWGEETTAAADIAPPGTSDWCCVGYDASHTYTSPDVVPTPLKLHWVWQPPESEQAEIFQVVSSGGVVFVHGRHSNSTPIGSRNGCHNWILDLETGVLQKEDPSGTTPNDTTYGHAIGTYGGSVYQCDDGGPPYGGCDVWSPVQISIADRFWAVVQQSKGDGPNPGIYCMPVGQSIGSGWYAGAPASGFGKFCDGNVAIAGGKLFTTTQWTIQGPAVVNGLACYDLSSGHRNWTLDGKFVAVSANSEWCVAVDERMVMVAVSNADGKVLAMTDISSLPECPPMMMDHGVALYDESGSLRKFQLIEKTVDKKDKFTFKSMGQSGIGRFEGPRILGRNNCPFCFSADGTMFLTSGSGITAVPSSKKARHWSWNIPNEYARAMAPLGQPIIAHSKLVVVGRGCVLCFDREGAPKEAEPSKKHDSKP